MRSGWPPMPATPRSFRTVLGKPKIQRLPTSRSAPPPVRSRRARPAGPIGSANTISCCASRKSWARPQPLRAKLPSCMHKLVLLRHGESTWNQKNRFTGWTDVDLSERSYDIPPPPLTGDDPRPPARDPRYAALSSAELPLTETLKDTVARFLPYWHATIAPSIKSGKRVIVAAHGNSLRALVKYLDNIDERTIVELNIPTGIPLVYELDDDLRPIRHYYLGDPAAAAAAAARVANQTNASNNAVA